MFGGYSVYSEGEWTGRRSRRDGLVSGFWLVQHDVLCQRFRDAGSLCYCDSEGEVIDRDVMLWLVVSKHITA